MSGLCHVPVGTHVQDVLQGLEVEGSAARGAGHLEGHPVACHGALKGLKVGLCLLAQQRVLRSMLRSELHLQAERLGCEVCRLSER